MSNSKPHLYVYTGKDADVQWDERLCIHVGECGRAAGDLFENGRDPWCQPDVAGLDEVIEVVQRCPTGALVALPHDGRAVEATHERNTVHVANHGPLYLQGDLDIAGADEDMVSVRYRAALCRCGKSKRKPFCDNAHEAVDFDDRGAIGRAGDGFDQEGGRLEVKVAPNGPLMLKGNFTIIAPNGRVAYRGTRAALCRCGSSKNKPFCDGAHKAAGFTAD